MEPSEFHHPPPADSRNPAPAQVSQLDTASAASQRTQLSKRPEALLHDSSENENARANVPKLTLPSERSKANDTSVGPQQIGSNHLRKSANELEEAEPFNKIYQRLPQV